MYMYGAAYASMSDNDASTAHNTERLAEDESAQTDQKSRGKCQDVCMCIIDV